MSRSKFVSIGLPVIAASVGSSFGTKYYLDKCCKEKDEDKSETITKWNYNWDNRQKDYESIPEKDRINGKRSLTLVRHSQYQRIESGIMGTNDNQPLTELGRKQALLTAQRLNHFDIKFDKIYCSKFERAMETCEIIVNELKHNTMNDVIYEKGLNEGLACMVEPYHNYRSKELFTKQMKKQSPEINEAFEKLFHRRDKNEMFKNENSKKREDILIIGHGNVFRYFLTIALQFDKHGWARFDTSNCSISRINIFDNGIVKLTHWNDTGHMDQLYLTNNRKGVSL